ncbi:uncharacterized protein HKW66_Vig0015000 [Vigna angularis]|uniref:Homeobox domain-containing protein n=1 Tax=Phaseolus angularis TaxID=3914 RepID=A0A8T0LJE7_PHAAN|nr:uncharacterized protein HKW66_Vig0015000 [Vigna angularis]
MERYTSQRWKPTDDQVKMMTNIFNHGVTHPSRAQVVEITSRLRAFGEVSEYNVHCWFNNHGNRVRRWQAELDPTGTVFSQLPLSKPLPSSFSILERDFSAGAGPSCCHGFAGTWPPSAAGLLLARCWMLGLCATSSDVKTVRSSLKDVASPNWTPAGRSCCDREASCSP